MVENLLKITFGVNKRSILQLPPTSCVFSLTLRECFWEAGWRFGGRFGRFLSRCLNMLVKLFGVISRVVEIVWKTVVSDLNPYKKPTIKPTEPDQHLYDIIWKECCSRVEYFRLSWVCFPRGQPTGRCKRHVLISFCWAVFWYTIDQQKQNKQATGTRHLFGQLAWQII